MFWSPKFRAASNQVIDIRHVVSFVVQMGNVQGRAWLRVVQNLAVSVLLEATYIDNWILRWHLTEGKIISQHLGSVAILWTDTEVIVKKILSHKAPRDNQMKHATIPVA